MAVIHTPTDIVHSGHKTGTTGCGDNTNDLPSHWENTTAAVTCQKNGCKGN